MTAIEAVEEAMLIEDIKIEAMRMTGRKRGIVHEASYYSKGWQLKFTSVSYVRGAVDNSESIVAQGGFTTCGFER
jgi:hypothetical protein